VNYSIIVRKSLFLAVLAVILPIYMGKASCEEKELPNILIISLDSLRPDHFSCYGYPKDTTPNIDKLAKEGVLFKQVISESNWSLGAYNFHTSLYPPSYVNGHQNGHQVVPEGFDAPAKILKKLGYEIADGGYVLQNSGFDTKINGASTLNINPLISAIEKYKGQRFLLYYQWVGMCLPYNPPEPYDTMFFPKNYIMTRASLVNLDVIREARCVRRWNHASPAQKEEFLKNFDPTKVPVKGAGSRFFVGFADLEPEDAIPVRALYDGDARWTDECIGKVVDKLKELKLYDKTLIIITSDNSEELMERGNVGHASESNEGTLFDELLKVGVIIRYPKAIPPDTVVDSQVQPIDVFPTIFEMLGIAIPKTYQGKSLLPLIKGEKKKIRDYAFAEGTPGGSTASVDDSRIMRCVRTERWKLIKYENFSPAPYYELYDLKKDPYEKKNIIDEEPDIARDLKSALEDWLSSCEKLKKELALEAQVQKKALAAAQNAPQPEKKN
jgi:arylsulfatase A-like enzyme